MIGVESSSQVSRHRAWCGVGWGRGRLVGVNLQVSEEVAVSQGADAGVLKVGKGP